MGEEAPELRVALLSADARAPINQRGSIGLDIFASKPAILRPHSKVLVATDIAVQCAPGWYARILPRSGLALQGIVAMAGVLDNGHFPRPITVLLYALLATTDYVIGKHMRVAQLVVSRAMVPRIVLASPEEEGKKRAPERSGGGWGSTGDF